VIERVDHYLKRAYFPPEAERLALQTRARLAPFGFNYGCRSTRSTLRTLAAIGGAIALTGRGGLDRLRQFVRVPTAPVFEQAPSVPVQPRVAFQTRLWAPGEVPPDEVEPLNTERVAMVRALKREFGSAFIGGLVPTAFAREHYPGDLTPHSSKYAEYLRIKKECLISVYTRGVEHSLAFKLGETFAASQCLVSVPLRYQVPKPLAPNGNYVLFDLVDECVAACHRLLEDRSWAQQMRENNHRYYLDEIEPAAHMANVLQRCAG
jgi:hypothetical protein